MKNKPKRLKYFKERNLQGEPRMNDDRMINKRYIRERYQKYNFEKKSMLNEAVILLPTQEKYILVIFIGQLFCSACPKE